MRGIWPPEKLLGGTEIKGKMGISTWMKIPGPKFHGVLSLFPIGIPAPKKKTKSSSHFWPNFSSALNQPLPKVQGEKADLSQLWIRSRIHPILPNFWDQDNTCWLLPGTRKEGSKIRIKSIFFIKNGMLKQQNPRKFFPSSQSHVGFYGK